LATDGKTQKRILWVDFTSNGVYSGYCSNGKDMHSTYHADGSFFINWLGEKPKKIGTFQPLDEFKGSHQLFSTGFTILTNTPYKLKRLDAIVSVDQRNYPNGIGCSITLIEQNDFQLLGTIAKAVPLATEVHSFLQCKPWLSMIVYTMKSPKSVNREPIGAREL
jgi:hypothetical protein